MFQTLHYILQEYNFTSVQNSAVERYHIPHIQEKVREDVSKLFCAAKQAFLNFRLCNAILHTCKKLIQPLQEVGEGELNTSCAVFKKPVVQSSITTKFNF